MFKVLYRCNRTVERHTNSPMADSRRRYLGHLASGGASPNMMRNAAALHLGPQSCRWHREVSLEAQTGVSVGRAIELRKTQNQHNPRRVS
jgi:hypothetical protein